jgi:hypothetical protein
MYELILLKLDSSELLCSIISTFDNGMSIHPVPSYYSPFEVPQQHKMMTEAIQSPSTRNIHQNSFPSMRSLRERPVVDRDTTEHIEGEGDAICDKHGPSATSPRTARCTIRTKMQKGSNVLDNLRIIRATSSSCSKKSGGDKVSVGPPKEVLIFDGQRRYCVSPASCSNREARQHHKMVEDLLASCSRRVVAIRKPSRFTFDVVPSVSTSDSLSTDRTTSPNGVVLGNETKTILSPDDEMSILEDLAKSETNDQRSNHSREKHSKPGNVHLRARARTSSTELSFNTAISGSKETHNKMNDNPLKPTCDDMPRSCVVTARTNDSSEARSVVRAETSENALLTTCGSATTTVVGLLNHGHQNDVQEGNNLVSLVGNQEEITESAPWFSFTFFFSWFF